MVYGSPQRTEQIEQSQTPEKQLESAHKEVFEKKVASAQLQSDSAHAVGFEKQVESAEVLKSRYTE